MDAFAGMTEQEIYFVLKFSLPEHIHPIIVAL
jgi:hypothetical protein